MIITGDFNMIIENHPFNEFMEMLLFRVLTLFRMDYSGAAHRWEGGKGGGGEYAPTLPIICHTYPCWNLAQLYLT